MFEVLIMLLSNYVVNAFGENYLNLAQLRDKWNDLIRHLATQSCTKGKIRELEIMRKVFFLAQERSFGLYYQEKPEKNAG